jgi:hypothetical protein
MKQIGVHETTTQERTRIERETKLRRKIDTWMGVQQLFIPEVVVLRDRETAERRRVAATQALPGLKAQDMKLWFPSTIGNSVQCDRVLREYEFKLRKGQAVLALNEMRGNLLLRMHEFQYREGVHGVKAKLRSGARTDAPASSNRHCGVGVSGSAHRPGEAGDSPEGHRVATASAASEGRGYTGEAQRGVWG